MTVPGGGGGGWKGPRLSLTAEYVIWHVQKCQSLAKCKASEPFFFSLPVWLAAGLWGGGSRETQPVRGWICNEFLPTSNPPGCRSGFFPLRSFGIRWGAVPAPALQVDRPGIPGDRHCLSYKSYLGQPSLSNALDEASFKIPNELLGPRHTTRLGLPYPDDHIAPPRREQKSH